MTNGSKDKHKLVAPKRHFPDPKASKKKPSKPTAAKSSRSSAKRKRTPAKKAGFVTRSMRALGRMIWWTGSRFAIVFGLILGGFVAIDYRNLPDANSLMDERQRGSVTMLDHQGNTFAWRGDQFGGLVEPDTISPHLRNAVIATEDKRFYRHLGISPRGIAGAIRTNLREGRSAFDGHGGSTITQQVAKDVYFLDLPSKKRKLKEVPMSIAMELKYTKDEILAIYLNRAYLGSGTNGFEAASQRYFGKSAREVNPAEAAMLAGLLKAPTRYAPTRNLERSQERANLIIGLMEAQGYLTKSQATDARVNPAQLSEVARERAGGYFADWVMEAAPEFIIKDAKQDVVIKTTFDKRIQKSAEEALKYVFEEKVKQGSKAQAAIVVLSKDGAVRAMVGGRHTGAEGSFNRATQALRQTGSAFKTFVYAAALESGYQYDSVVLDEPITINIPGSGPWTPDNYLKGTYLGETTLTTALAKSINTTAVRVSEDIGRKRVEAVAHDFGINRDLAPGPALALGASESTLLEMTGAYAGILNSGRLAIPYGLTALTIQGDPEPLLGKSGGSGLRVINDRAAEQLTYMMNQVVETGTGRRAKLQDREVAGKTGTTNSARDAWFIGFTGDYVAGVWMGYDDNSKLSGVTGGGLPAEIWKETMLRVHQGMPATPLNMIRPVEPPSVPEPEIAKPAPREKKRQTAEKPFEKFEKKLDKRMKKIEDDAENILNQILNSLKKKN